ncbi:hypothetical protein C8R45DRAFT_412538 [Mycena sanguinolenta]|nr:hypothetical protein C8R45DRAFT_412538 [Mycena sanguinolenta]
MHNSLNVDSQIHLICNDALSAYLVPTFSGDGAMELSPVLAEDIPKLSTFADTNIEEAFSEMHVRESPLREGVYRVWIHGTNYAAKNDGLFSCTLSIPHTKKPSWCQRSRLVEGRISSYGVSYSGHSLHYDRNVGYTVFSAALSALRRSARVELPSCGTHIDAMPPGDYIDVAPYDGTFTYATPSSVVIQYYK